MHLSEEEKQLIIDLLLDEIHVINSRDLLITLDFSIRAKYILVSELLLKIQEERIE